MITRLLRSLASLQLQLILQLQSALALPVQVRLQGYSVLFTALSWSSPYDFYLQRGFLQSFPSKFARLGRLFARERRDAFRHVRLVQKMAGLEQNTGPVHWPKQYPQLGAQERQEITSALVVLESTTSLATKHSHVYTVI